jgi:hypothetical protein
VAKLPKALIGSGAVNIVVDEQAISEFLQRNKSIRDLLFSAANNVKTEMEATASDAEGGPGGDLDGYAAAGFEARWDARGGRRPRINIVSLADPYMAIRVNLSTQVRYGIMHLRAALYKFTNRG